MDTMERIFYLLSEKKMEQKEFAAKIGVSKNVVSTWRTGRTKSYSRHLSKIAEVLGVAPDYLLTGDEEVPPVLGKANQDLAGFVSECDEFTIEERERIKGFIQGVLAKRK